MDNNHRKRSIDVTDQDAADILNQSVSSAKKLLLDSSYENKGFITELQIPLAVQESELSDIDDSEVLNGKNVGKTAKQNKRLRRSTSVPNLLDIVDSKASVSQRRATTTIIPPVLNETTDVSLTNWDSFDGCRSHELCSVRVKSVLSGVECSSCNAPIKFGAMSRRCNVCKLSFHFNCAHKIVFPCLPKKETPKSLHGKGRLRLGDYCPDDRPMIPHIIGHCVLFLERSDIPECLYDSNGDDGNSSKLMVQFKKSKYVPKLLGLRPNDVAGCLKQFLAEIRDPLIPLSDTQDFIEGSSSEDCNSKLISLVKGLPHPHCDTIIYLVKHWKRLGETSFRGVVDQHALCRRIGPVAMGVGRPGCQITEEQAVKVMSSLMEISMDSWNDLEVEANSHCLSRKSSQSSHELIRFASSINILG